MGAGREPVSRGGLEGPGQSLAGVYPFLVPGVEGGRVSSLTLRPRKGMWGSSRISTFRDRKFRLSDRLEGMQPASAFPLWLLTLGVTLTGPPAPISLLQPLFSIPGITLSTQESCL